METLPYPTTEIREAYAELVQQLDLHMARLVAGPLAGKIRCVAGCSDCCRPFSVLPLEAAMLQALGAEAQRAGADADEYCLFLRDDRCSMYHHRPLICRTQGLAIGYVDGLRGAIEVSACVRNFPDDYEFQEDELLLLDTYNSRLAELNHRYCRQHGLAPDLRVPLAQCLPR